MDPNFSSSATENAYQFAANEDHVQEVTENPYDHVQTCGSKELPENTSKEHSKPQTIIKIVFLSTILVLLFGLTLCGIILISQEKVRLDETQKKNQEIKADMQRQQRDANETWIQKIIALELQVKSMLRAQSKVNATWMAKISAVKSQMKKTSKNIQLKFQYQETQNNLTIRKLKTELNYLLTEAGWQNASNGIYYKWFKDRQTYADASLQCQLRGARLVSKGLRDQGIRADLVKFIKDKDKNVWIGLNDIKKEGVFVWEDGVTSNASNIEWADKQPDDHEKKEDCAYYQRNSWHVNDNPCENSYAYICEKEGN